MPKTKSALPDSETRVRVTYVIPRHLDVKIELIAEGSKAQKSEIIEKALRAYCDKNKGELEKGLNAIHQKLTLANV